MGHVILGNMRVCMGPYLPEPGSCLQLAGLGAMEWQALLSKMYARGKSGGIKNGYVGSLDKWIGCIESLFVEDELIWEGKDTGQSDWKSLVKDNL